MCVIAICPPKVRPSHADIRTCWDSNPHGAGIAWRENGEVRWRKTNDVPELIQLAEMKRGEIVMHFRIASVGGVCDELRHPFPVSKRAGLADYGTARAVLFQNGTWGGYEEAIALAASQGHEVPAGRMSDARAAAWLCSIYGKDFLKDAGHSKWVFFGATATSVFGQWSKAGRILYSNTYWKRGLYVVPKADSRPRTQSSLSFRNDPGFASIDEQDELCDPCQSPDSIPGPTPEETKPDRPLELWHMDSTQSYWDRLRASLPKPTKPIKR